MPAVLDVFDAQAVTDAVAPRAPRPSSISSPTCRASSTRRRWSASYPLNARIRIEGTRNLIAAAQAASVWRFIVQSIAFAYVPGGEPHPETDPLNFGDAGARRHRKGAAAMERAGAGRPWHRRHRAALRPALWAGHLVPGARPAARLCTSTPRRRRRAAGAQPRRTAASTILPMMTAWSRSPRRVAELGFDPQFRLE